MANYAECDLYGWFNGIYGIEQSNWANFWHGIIPDGVISGENDELEVYAQSDGMKVHVKTGKAIVAGHCCWVTGEKVVDIAANSTGSDRVDGIFVRVTYGNDGESVMQIVVKTGSISASHTIGGTYELLLASVTVPNGAVTLAASAVTDYRYIFRLAHDYNSVDIITVTYPDNHYVGEVDLKNDRIHRNVTPLTKLTINLPANPHRTYISEVDFITDSTTFNGVEWKQGSTTITPKLAGDALTLTNRKYNMVIWYDDQYWWVAAKAATI